VSSSKSLKKTSRRRWQVQLSSLLALNSFLAWLSPEHGSYMKCLALPEPQGVTAQEKAFFMF
jgi:hypothetical protein